MQIDGSKVRDQTLRRALENLSATITPAEAIRPSSAEQAPTTRRRAPEGDAQKDFFVPSLYDVPIKDGIDLMDIAVFRLSKKSKRKGDVIRHEVSGGVVEVNSGAHGMATIYDYDLVLMMISHLTEQLRLHREGRGPTPARAFRPHSADVFKFCRTGHGGEDYKRLEHALDRLQGTYIKITMQRGVTRRSGGFPLIAGYTVVSRTDTNRIGEVEIKIPDWIYDGVVKHQKPEILTVNRDYFLINKGLARFIYRLARRAAGMGGARYNVTTLHERSASEAEPKEFARMLKDIVRANDLPDYALRLEDGKDGPILVMERRTTTTLGDAACGG